MPLEDIVPKSNFVEEIDISSLCNSQTLGFVRRSLKSKEDILDDVDEIRVDAICSNYNEIPGLSFNILGALFIIKDLEYTFKKKAVQKWDGLEVEINDYKAFIESTLNPIPIYFLSSDLIITKIPHESVHNESIKELLKKIEDESKYTILNGKVSFSLSTSVQHEPTFLNYWHAELNIFNNLNDKKLRRNDVDNFPTVTTEANRINTLIAITIFKSIIIPAARLKLHPSDYSSIDTSHYYKN